MNIGHITFKTRKQWIIFLAGSILGLAALVGIVGGGLIWFFTRDLPQFITIQDYRPVGVTRVVTSDNGKETTVGEFFTERRYLVPYEKIPEGVIQAFVSAEDEGFFEHQGISPMAMIRASIANFRAGHVVQGGSTITQQVAKSLFLSPERSFVRKLKEVFLANRIERNLNKQQILYLYLNQIYLGHGAHGIQAAARVYYHKDVSKLTIGEAALLAGMPRAPSKYSPFINSKKAKERQRYVLKRMYDAKYITEEQMIESAAKPLRIFYPQDVNKSFSSHYVEHIRKMLVQKYGEDRVYQDALTVTIPTTSALLALAHKQLQDGIRQVDRRRGYRGPLRRLKNQQEVEAFLTKAREELVKARVPYTMFLPDGTLGMHEAVQDAELSSEEELITAGNIYEGVVTAVNDRSKTAVVKVASISATLPLKSLGWIYPTNAERPMPTPPAFPSEVLSVGDVIMVRLNREDPTTAIDPKRKVPQQTSWVAELEQKPVVEGALLSLDLQTGNVLAMEGGFDFEQSEFNRAIQAVRQPGSAFKPVIFSAAIEQGYTPASIFVDSPIVFQSEDFGKWKPGNFEKKFYGDTTLRMALVKSRNIPTIRTVQALGVERVIEHAKRLGFAGPFRKDLSLSLGSSGATLQELVLSYGLMGRHGKKLSPVFVSKVVDRDGMVLEEAQPVLPPDPAKVLAMAQISPTGATPTPGVSPAPSPSPSPTATSAVQLPTYPPAFDPDQLMDPRVAFVMTHLMKEVVTYGTGAKAKGLGRPAAAKTGTTSDYKDAWFLGFTPHVVTGVWVGVDDQKESLGPGETGARAALPIWLGFMQEAVKPFPVADFPVPPGIVFSPIDLLSGKLSTTKNPNARLEAFIAGTEPTEKEEYSGESVDSQSEFLKEAFE